MRFRKKKSVASVSVRIQEQNTKKFKCFSIFHKNILYLERRTSQTIRCQRFA